jgi:glycerophosphoryl diester phosphodiesterase
MIIVGSLILLGLLFLGLVAYLTKPGTRKCGLDKFTKVKFAHRGLHNEERAENSISAFRAAVEAGYGIELDVRLSKDGELVVFHDPTLKRMTSIEGKVIDYTREELATFRLGNTEDTVPTLREVLDTVDGRVPLLIEIKMQGDERGIAEKLAEVIADYRGEYIVESFNPLALRTFKKLMPKIPIGILSMQYGKEEAFRGKLLYFLLENLALNFLMRPDFIAYEKGGSANAILRYIRKTYETPLFAWTVRSAEEEERAISDGFDTVIFEKYIPEDK